MSLPIEFPSNSNFYFTAITIVITITLEDKIKYYINLSKSKTLKVITFGYSITFIVLISTLVFTLLDIIMIIMSPIFKVGVNISTLFYILSAIPFYCWYSIEVRREETNKRKENLKIKDFFNSATEKTYRIFKNSPNLFLILSIFLIAIGIIFR